MLALLTALALGTMLPSVAALPRSGPVPIRAGTYVTDVFRPRLALTLGAACVTPRSGVSLEAFAPIVDSVLAIVVWIG